MRSLGLLYENGPNYAKAREWYEKAAEKGDAPAMVHLGELYERGNGVALGSLYGSGLDVLQDYLKAREWYEKAADKGDERAKANLEKLAISQAVETGRHAEALRLQEALAAKVEAAETKQDGKPGNGTAENLLQVTWFALFARDFTKALMVADRAHALFPDNLAIEMNRAHALMFLGRQQECRALYLAHKGKPISEQGGRAVGVRHRR